MKFLPKSIYYTTYFVFQSMGHATKDTLIFLRFFIILIIFCTYVLISLFLLPIFFMNTEHLLDTLFKSMFFCVLLMDVVNLVSFLHKISCMSKQSFSLIMVSDAYRWFYYLNITYGLLKVENLGKGLIMIFKFKV